MSEKTTQTDATGAATEAAEAAAIEAGAADSGWNRRYVEALTKRGYRIVRVSDERQFRRDNPDWFMPPIPHKEGAPYPYPSFVVPVSADIVSDAPWWRRNLPLLAVAGMMGAVFLLAVLLGW